MQKIIDKVNSIKKFLNENFFERTEVIDGLFVALAAKENLLMIGPPGAAKSQISRMLFKKCLDGVNYFEKAFTKTTKPEEVVGPMSLKGLEAERYYHVTKGYLPECHVGLLDEIFKCNSSVLHLMLPLANTGERLFQQEGAEIKTPLFSLIGTSNEYPEEEEGLEAFYNRFILRYEVNYINEAGNFVNMLDLKPVNGTNIPKISLAELQTIQLAVCQQVSLSLDTKENIVKIWQQLIADGLRPSDRQFRDSIKLIKANALLTGGRLYTEPGDLDILRHSLWEKPEDRQQIASVIRKFTVDDVQSKIERLLNDAKDVYDKAMADATTEAGTESNKKMKYIKKKLQELSEQNPSKKELLEKGIKTISEYNNDILKTCLGI
jgi:MoxR-like ATPase